MTEQTTISTEPLEHKGMDFAFLRQEGIQMLEDLVGETWTNFNTSDPGVTILEQLCYAITDLSYRLSFDIEDLLAENPEEVVFESSLFPAESILPMNPLTLADFRKILLDAEGVKNAWIEKAEYPEPILYYSSEKGGLTFQSSTDGEMVLLNGLYQVTIEKNELDENGLALSDEDVIQTVKNKIQPYRNLCEDFAKIQVLPSEEITVHLTLDLEEEYDPDQVVADVYYQLESYITPPIQFYSLEECLEQGKRIEEIFTGPRLDHGFIDETELQSTDKKAEIYTSDLIRIILAVDGVAMVSDLSLVSSKSSDIEEWVLKLDQTSVPILKRLIDDPNDSERQGLISERDDSWKCYKNEIACYLDPEEANECLLELRKKGDSKHTSNASNTLPIPFGEYRQLAVYNALRYYFPDNYGLRPGGLASTESDKRKAQVNQLNGYLTIFDQLLTNAFIQLDQSKKLFSLEVSQEEVTYYSQKLGIPEDLFNDYYEDALKKGEVLNEKERKNRFLNHLAARFGERYLDSSLLGYKKEQGLQQRADDLSAFLKAYPQLGTQRTTAFNYTSTPTWDTSNVAGLKARICHLLGIKNIKRKDLANAEDEGFHLLEHILLRPQIEDTGSDSVFLSTSESDPYSFQVSFFFPEWPSRFQKSHFRELILATLKAEVPVHVHFGLYWLNQGKMGDWETKYKSWLEKKATFYQTEWKTQSEKDEATLLLQNEAASILEFIQELA